MLYTLVYAMQQKDNCKSAGAKAVPKMMMKVTSGVNFTKMLFTVFAPVD